MNTSSQEQHTATSICNLVISILLGSLLLIVSLVFLATSSHASSPAILAVHPSEAPNNFDNTIVITGTDFQVIVNGSAVLTTPVVRLGGEVLVLEGLVTSRTLTAAVPWGLEPGVYAVSVENADGTTATLTNAFTVTAGLDVWTTGGPFGGSVHHLEMDRAVTSTLYANLGMTGLFKTEDGGEHWYNIFPGYIVAHAMGFTLKPDDPETIYLSGDLDGWGGLLRSTNGGEDWEVLRDGDQWVVGVSPGDPDYVYISNGTTISLSTDDGNTWQSAGNGIPGDVSVSILAAHPVTPDIAYAGVDSGGIYKTTDGGSNWTATGANLGEAWWRNLVIDPHAPERIYASGWHIGHFFARSLDGGENWEAMTLGPDEFSSNDLQFHPTVSGTMYAQTSSGIYSSTDAGATWVKMPIPSEAREGWALLLHPQTGLPFYIGHNGKAVFRSDNGGVDWQVRNRGLAGLRPHDSAPSPADPRYIYLAAAESGAFVSNNGGQSWLAAAGPEWAWAAAADPYSPTVAYIGGRRDIFRTADGGQTWVSHELPGLPAYNEMRVHAIAIDPNDPRVVYAGAGNWDFLGGAEHGWLYRSLDAGVTWNAVSVTFPISPVTDIVIDPTDGQTVYVASGRRWEDSTDKSSGIIKTSDGGETWRFVNQGLTALNVTRLAINPGDTQILYAGANLEDAVADGGVFKTVDGGEHWEQSAEEMRISGLEIDPLVTDTLYAGSYWIGLFRSTDAGASWERVNGPLGRLSSLCLNVTAAQSRTIVYAGVSGGLVNFPASNGANVSPAAADSGQFFGSGVYQLTVDRRHRPAFVFLPMVLKK